MLNQPDTHSSLLNIIHGVLTTKYYIDFLIIYCIGIIITNGPQDTTMCIYAIGECDCGFSGANPATTVPNWRIIIRNDDGSVVSNVTHTGFDIVQGHINGLQWSPDLTSGDNTSPNSKLLVGPVDKAHNQSSYQCIILTLSGTVISSVGTMAVVGKANNDCSNTKIIIVFI